MIINRTGRRIFPYVKFTLKGLDPAGLYDIMFDIIPADTNYFKFVDNKWFSLRTLQKYLVKISLIKHKTDIFSVLEIPIPVPTFEAVTAYNNRQVTELKIKSNPYSKAFRYPKSRMKKPSVSLSDKKTNKHQNKKIPTSRMDMFTESFDEIHHIQQPSQSTALQNDRRRSNLFCLFRFINLRRIRIEERSRYSNRTVNGGWKLMVHVTSLSNCKESFKHGDLSIMSSQYESGHQLTEAIF